MDCNAIIDWGGTAKPLAAIKPFRRRQEGECTLSASETAKLDHYLNFHDLAVLQRARAMAILAQRGHVITGNELVSEHNVA